MRRRVILFIGLIFLIALGVRGQTATTQPGEAQFPTTQAAPAITAPATTGPAEFGAATRPAGRQSAEEMLSQMLRPASQAARPLQPVADGGGGVFNRTTGANAVAPGAPTLPLLPEGTNIYDRVARLAKTTDGQWELTLESDGRVMQDPPLLVLPNRALTSMERAMANNDADLRFRVSGELTEYNGRNYILIQRAPVIHQVTEPLR